MDEAYYWGWAQSFEFGYFSKPPMIAWLIMLTSQLFGDASPLAVKSGALLVYPLTTLVIFLLARELFSEKVGFAAALTFLTLPVVGFSSIIVSTDVLLFLCWVSGIYFFRLALDRNSLWFWVLAGIAGGVGLLTKYTMIIFPISAALFLVTSEQCRNELKKPGFYIALGVAVLVFMPNIIWNFLHDFPTVRHTAQISELDQELFNPLSMIVFLLEQVYVFGPILFGIFVYLLARPNIWWADARFRMLFFFAVPFLAVITLQSLLARAHGNWGAPTYVAATIFVVGYLIQKAHWKTLYAAIAVNLLLTLLPYHFQQLSRVLDLDLAATPDPYVEVKGWGQFGDSLEVALSQHPNAKLLSSERPLLAQAIYQVKPHPFDAVLWNPQRIINNHYAITTTMDDKVGKDFVFVTTDSYPQEVLSRFSQVARKPDIIINRHPYPETHFYLYFLQGFSGYE